MSGTLTKTEAMKYLLENGDHVVSDETGTVLRWKEEHWYIKDTVNDWHECDYDPFKVLKNFTKGLPEKAWREKIERICLDFSYSTFETAFQLELFECFLAECEKRFEPKKLKPFPSIEPTINYNDPSPKALARKLIR